jgi:hypothetical protein
LLNNTGLESTAELMARVQLVETNAQLLLEELRQARRLADQANATLSLIVGLLAQTREVDGGYVVGRLFQDLLLCAQSPELVAQIAACEADAVDPHMIRATAALLTGDVDAVLRAALGENPATAH